MSKKSVDEIISLAKNIINQAANNGEAAAASPELMDAIQSVTAQIKRSAGSDSELAALVDQVQSLAKGADKQ
ncbi:hypothetical protein [Limnohabitans parvus]|uniref:Uncharacterized protein n=1 Tax=Limnohabitans parvus II-B4 TaxID=1293052 RepID=A0A315EIL2_9BURK|nr:hypothetical protein [Limnohabitans parvus]PUE55694.1 hypothetical protein B9Z37_03905 [Limnohabitans parvus II-B4]